MAVGFGVGVGVEVGVRNEAIVGWADFGRQVFFWLDLDRLDEAVKVRAAMEVNKTAIATINVNNHFFKIFSINNLSNFTRTNYSPQGTICSFGRTFKKHTVL